METEKDAGQRAQEREHAAELAYSACGEKYARLMFISEPTILAVGYQTSATTIRVEINKALSTTLNSVDSDELRLIAKDFAWEGMLSMLRLGKQHGCNSMSARVEELRCSAVSWGGYATCAVLLPGGSPTKSLQRITRSNMKRAYGVTPPTPPKRPQRKTKLLPVEPE